jgi:hypothetical protein
MGEIERQVVYDMYPGLEWKKKVKRMSDAQVIAIYLKEKNKKKPSRNKPLKDKPADPSDDIPF